MRKRLFSLFFFLLVLLISSAAAQDGPCILNDILYGENAGWKEVTLGSATADALIWETGAQAAILPGGMFHGNLRGGTITQEEIDQAVDGTVPLSVAQIDPAQLFELLEVCFSHLTLNERERLDTIQSDSDIFPQISGFSIRVDASAPAGRRIVSLAMDGIELSPEDSGPITLCAPAALLEEWGTDCQLLPSDRTAGTVLYSYIASGALSQEPESRLDMIGTLDDSLMDHFPMAALGIVLVIFVLFGIVSVRQNGRPASRRYGTR